MGPNILTKSEGNGLLDLIHSLCSVKDIGELHLAAKVFKELIESDHIIFGLPAIRPSDEDTIEEINHDYPEDWVNIYQENELWRIDPVVLACKDNYGPLHWGRIYKEFPPDPKFIKMALDFGVRDGWTCRTQVGNGIPWSIVSIVGGYKKNKERTFFLLERTVTHFHLALSSVRKNISNVNQVNKLSKREQEVLLWVSQGKTSWEISKIFNRSEATVNYHMKNINKKLNTVGRSQAVAVALHKGLLS